MVEPSPTTARNALVIVAVVVVGAALHWMGAIITPLLLALFLLIMVDGFARVIRRRAPFLPPVAAMAVALTTAAALSGLAAFIVASYAGDFVDNLSSYGVRLNGLVARVASDVGAPVPPSIDALFSKLDPSQYLGAVAETLQDFTSSAVLVVIYLGFLIASRRAFERKAVRLFRGREERHEAMQVFLHIRDGVERYLWIQTLTGLMIAGASWGIMEAVGLQNAFFWAFLIFLVNYVPIVGAAAGIGLPALFALVQFPGYGQAAMLLGGLWVITFIVGNIFLPRMQGDSLNMDPLIVLLSLAFWGAIWGLPGMFLSTPLTVLAMVILAQFEGTKWIAIMLSADGDLEAWRRVGAPGEGTPAPALTQP